MASYVSRRSKPHVDFLLIIIPYLIAVIGILSISVAMYTTSHEGDSLLAIIMSSRSGQMQVTWLALSIPVYIIVSMIPLELIRTRYYVFYLFVLGLLMITLVISKAVNGINSWLQTGFGRAIQPCEFAKIVVLLTLAKKFSDRENPFTTFRGWINLAALVGIPSLVVLAQGETGSVIVIGAMFLVMLLLSDTSKTVVISIIVLLAALIVLVFGYALLSNSTDYRVLRLLAFTDPQAYSSSGGYQLLQSQKAIGAGQLSGVGLYQADSMATLRFVPESSTDFIFSVIGETSGFIGSIAVLVLYLILFIHMLIEGRYTSDRFGRMIIFGVLGMLAFHVFENVAMVIGLMPITGIPLPFISYGGSSFLTNMTCVALAFNVIRQRTTMSYEGLQLENPHWSTDALRFPDKKEMAEQKIREKEMFREQRARRRTARRSLGEIYWGVRQNGVRDTFRNTLGDSDYRSSERAYLGHQYSRFRRFIDKVF